MKITTPAAVVVSVGIVSVSATMVCLATLAHMDSGTLIALGTAASSILGTLVMQLRANAKLTEHDQTLAKIDHQTNGLSAAERAAIARQAATDAIAAMKEQGRL